MNDHTIQPREEEKRLPSLFIDGLLQFITWLVLFMALLYNHQGLIYLTLLILVMVNGAKLWCRLSLTGISCRVTADKTKVFPLEKIALKAEVVNGKFLPVWLRFGAPVEGLLLFSSVGGVLSEGSGLLWKQRVTWKWELTAQKRGCHQVGPSYLAAGDLFGFFQRKKNFQSLEIIVFPRLIPLQEFSSPLQDFFGIKGAKGPVQDPIYPSATRDYQHGRPARYIHWKASARHNRLQEKVFEPTAQRKVLLVVDLQQFAETKADESFERSLEVVASLAVLLDQQRSAMGLVSNGSLAGGGPAVVPVSRSPGQLSAVLEILGRLQIKSSGTLEEILDHGISLSPGSSAICFCQKIDDRILNIREIFRCYKIPVSFVTAQSSGIAEISGSKVINLSQLNGGEGVLYA
ncbi:MAG: DUF58 domain-containing protein [Bacillota bacterium]|nr:DUF58 domain-containing protein [Bacillota bacterium]